MFFIDIELLFGVFFLGLTVQIRKKMQIWTVIIIFADKQNKVNYG